ncbi:MAG: cyclic nucleotide-binding/CBS domain-containing protein [Rhodocyclaceae bacterium]|nr:cyclic nucleotide-binding/CBS domain-containing protein [Rhodocyclaceae bacterium]MCP5231459.1 cyclic nucleotide-binding/CBS domain-containing protein [Zoogloeaceae bacterium]MCP5239283.1 cyclic nucleotide-binding/CBS domain-containing protein [Zoogloeaceae bacterium]MCP5255870.1 cyclic nucleotide-binding/CBS domain-containing protein [Zoogloeaceae bacterium]MCW5616059.1 cyclic nucleotide-binding/CBS domain-containing protein [Rhodocyclaceae bacterium]
MQDEQLEILDFLRRYSPFTELPEETLHRVATAVDVRYFKAGSRIIEFGEEALDWYVVRSGAVEIFRRNGTLYNRLTEGGHFGEFGLLNRKRVRFPAAALEDSLLYLIPEAVFTELFENNEQFADLVEVEDRTRLRQVVSRREDANQLMSATVDTLVGREPVMLGREATTGDAARRMTEEAVSSLLIVDQLEAPPAAPRMAGIITDRDIRIRLVSQGLDYDTPVAEIMSSSLVTVEHNQLVFEAMLQMLRNNVHHLPVLKNHRPIGVIALSDIIQYESRNSLFVVSSIFRQQSVDDLAALTGDVHACFSRMVTEDASSRMIGSAMAVIGRSFKQRLLELAEETLGPPPVPYCFLALGSMARQEQLIVTDQDNALVLDNSFDPARHDDYFKALAAFVSDGLARCGYSYCTGGVMATNAKWRQPLRQWERYFSEWIEQPTPESLLNSGIFFDIDGVWGETEWIDGLRRLISRKAKGNSRFLACLARNALLRTPPLGFFKDFVVESDGRHSRAINLKRRGTAPLADLVRVHALAVGSLARNSFERLNDIIEADVLPRGRGQDLLDAMEFVSMVRIRNQANDLAAGIEPDNSIEPDSLSEFERKSLRDAFLILSNAQKYLKFRYQPGRSG